MAGKKIDATQYSRYWMDQDIFDYDDEREDKGTDLARIVRLAAVRRATGNFVSILAGKNVPVAFSSGKQSYTDGSTVVISADDNPEKFDCTVGLALHEGSHILLSDTRFLTAINVMLGQLSRRQLPQVQQKIVDPRNPTSDTYKDRYGSVRYVDGAMNIVLCPELRSMVVEPDERGSLHWETYIKLPFWTMSIKMLEDIHRIANILEDRRIDKWVYRTAVGYRPYYQALYDHYFWTAEVGKNLKFNPEWRELTIDNYINRLLMAIHPDADPNALPGLAAILRLMDLPNIDRIAPENDPVAWVGQFPGPRVAVPAWWIDATYDNLPVAWKVANEIYAHIVKYATAGHQKSLTQPGQPEDTRDAQDKTAEEQIMDAAGKSEKMSDLPNLDGAPMSSAEMEPTAPEKDKKGKDGKYNAKKGAKAIKQAKDAQDGKEKKKKLTKPDEAAVTALEQADAKMVDLEGDGVPFGKCMVTRKMTDELIKQPWFIFGRPGWPEEAAKSIAAGKRMGAILFQRLQVRNDPLVTKQTRLPQGGLDRRLLAQLGMNIEAVFQKSRVDQHKPAMLHLTLDASGSMYGRKWSKVRTVAVALAYVGSKMRNVDTVVSIRGGNELPIVSIVYDSRKDLFSRFTHFMANIGPAGATPEGLCFKATMEMILECADTHDVYFINFSDGEPAFGYSANTKFGVKAKRRSRFSSQPDAYYTYGGDVAAKHTRTMVQQMRDRGVKVLSYFISEYGTRDASMRLFKKMYGEDAAFVNVENASEVIRTLNQRLLSRG